MKRLHLYSLLAGLIVFILLYFSNQSRPRFQVYEMQFLEAFFIVSSFLFYFFYKRKFGDLVFLKSYFLLMAYLCLFCTVKYEFDSLAMTSGHVICYMAIAYLDKYTNF